MILCLFLLFIQFLQIHCQNCQSGYVLILNTCQPNDISMSEFFSSIAIESSVGLKFFWVSQPLTNSITMMLQLNTPDWFGFGLGPTMLNSDMWVFQINPNEGSIWVNDTFGKTYSGPAFDTDYGGQENINLLGYSYNVNGTTTVKFQRALDTGIQLKLSCFMKGDEYDQKIETRYQLAIFAFGQNNAYTLANHGNNQARFSFMFDIDSNTTQIIQIRQDYFSIHRLVNFVVWGLLIDFPIIIVRYLKVHRWYLILHGVFSSLLVFASLFVEIAMSFTQQDLFKTSNFDLSSTKDQVHLVIGTIFTIIIFMQMVGGQMMKSFLEGTQIIKPMQSMKQFHTISGYLIYLLAKANVLIGFYLSFGGTKNMFDIFIYVLFVFTLFWRLALEIIFRSYQKLAIQFIFQKNKQSTDEEKNEQNLSLAQINENEQLFNYINLLDFESIQQEFPNKKWVIFNNLIIELTDQLHPGGQFIWEEVQGREVSRFIYGAQQLESCSLFQYKHSQLAIEMTKRQQIGKLRLFQLFTESQFEGDNEWTIQSFQDLTSNVRVFSLVKEDIQFQTFIDGIENCGRYFQLRSSTHGKISTRQYTMVLCMAKCNQEQRIIYLMNLSQLIENDLLLQNFDAKKSLELQESEKVLPLNNEKQAHQFPLMIKRYSSATGFSQHIHQLQLQDKVYLNGPFGTSFGINHQEAGTIVIIAGGTGVFPFLDFLNFLLMKTIYAFVIGKDGEEAARFFNPHNIQFEKYFKRTFKAVFLLTVQNEKDLIGADIYVSLSRLQPFLESKNFDLVLSISDGTNIAGAKCYKRARFNKEFLQENIPKIEDVSRFLVCGPPVLNREIPIILQGLGVLKNKIHLV